MAWTTDIHRWTCPECGQGESETGTESYYDPHERRITITRALRPFYRPCAPGCSIGANHAALTELHDAEVQRRD